MLNNTGRGSFDGGLGAVAGGPHHQSHRMPSNAAGMGGLLMRGSPADSLALGLARGGGGGFDQQRPGSGGFNVEGLRSAGRSLGGLGTVGRMGGGGGGAGSALNSLLAQGGPGAAGGVLRGGGTGAVGGGRSGLLGGGPIGRGYALSELLLRRD